MIKINQIKMKSKLNISNPLMFKNKNKNEKKQPNLDIS